MHLVRQVFARPLGETNGNFVAARFREDALTQLRWEIVAHLRELYGIEVSPDLISAVTDAVLDDLFAPLPDNEKWTPLA